MEYDKAMERLMELYDELFGEAERFVQELKRIVADSYECVSRRLASREGWDKPARFVPSGPRAATQARSVAAVMRWHTTATGE